MKFRGLKAEEIEIRVGSVGEYGASLLLYQDARCAMTILDETLGAENWQRDHKEVKGNLYCGIGIWDADKKDWIWKWDCGTESYTEKEKGESSDSMKRAAVNVGIARELYTAPFIFVKGVTQSKGKDQRGRDQYELTQDGKKIINGARVTEIEYEETEHSRKIKSLTICDRNGDVIYPEDWSRPKQSRPQPTKPTKASIQFLLDYASQVNVTEEQILKSYRINSLDEITQEIYDNSIARLKKMAENNETDKQ